MGKKRPDKKKRKKKARPREVFGFHIPAKIKDFRIDHLIEAEDWETEFKRRRDTR